MVYDYLQFSISFQTKIIGWLDGCTAVGDLRMTTGMVFFYQECESLKQQKIKLDKSFNSVLIQLFFLKCTDLVHIY